INHLSFVNMHMPWVIRQVTYMHTKSWWKNMTVSLVGLYGNGVTMVFKLVNKTVSLFLDMVGTLENNFMMEISVWMASFSQIVHRMKVTMNLNMNIDQLE